MNTIRYLAIVIHKLKEFHVIIDNLESELSKMGVVKNTMMRSEHFVSFLVKFDFLKVNSGAPKDEQKVSKLLLESPLEVKLCNHGFIMLETETKYSFLDADKEHILQTFGRIFTKIKQTTHIRDENQLLVPQDCKIIPDYQDNLDFDESVETTATTLIRAIDKAVDEQTKTLQLGVIKLNKNKDKVPAGSFEKHMDDIQALEKELTAYFYKLSYTTSTCELLNMKTKRFVKSALKMVNNSAELRTHIKSDNGNGVKF